MGLSVIAGGMPRYSKGAEECAVIACCVMIVGLIGALLPELRAWLGARGSAKNAEQAASSNH
jgi:hypothetical protein